MQVTVDIPDELAAELIAAGRDPAQTALEALNAYQLLLDLAEDADVRDGIRRGLDDVLAGRTRPAEEFFEEMRRKYAIPR